MGYVYVIGQCAACYRVMGFNPNTVPSIRIRGVKEPICESCAMRWKKLHPEIPFTIAPDAYEAADENEV